MARQQAKDKTILGCTRSKSPFKVDKRRNRRNDRKRVESSRVELGLQYDWHVFVVSARYRL